MTVQLHNQLFGEAFIMLNFEMTFEGVKSWFNWSGHVIDDAELFKTLLVPEEFSPERQAELLRMITFRYEDVFFQEYRDGDANEDKHQLLLRLMNVRTLRGINEAMIDLWITLKDDRLRETPTYPSLHSLFFLDSEEYANH